MINKFGRQVHLQDFDSNETNQAAADDVITSRSHGKLKSLYLFYQSAYGHQTWQDGNLST